MDKESDRGGEDWMRKDTRKRTKSEEG